MCIYTCWIFTDFPNPDHAKKISMHRILRFKGLFCSNDAGLCRCLQHFVEKHMNVKHYIKKMIHNVFVIISYAVYVQMNALTQVVIGSCLFISCYEFKLCFFSPLVLTCLKHVFEVRLLQRSIDFVRSRHSREEVPDVKSK